MAAETARDRLATRDKKLYEKYCSDATVTYRELGRRFGVSHERVRQIIEKLGLARAKASRDKLRALGEQELVYQDFASRAARSQACVICGCWVLRGSGALRTCSVGCAETFRTSSVRFAIDEREWLRHRARMARYWLENGTETQKRHARRVLSGVAARRGRWHIPGSRTATALARVCPDKLPPPAGKARRSEGGGRP